MDFLDRFSTKVKEIRIQKAMSQAEFARIINVQPRTVARLEQGLSSPSIETVVDICERLKISADDLLGLEKTKKSYVFNYIDKDIRNYLSRNDTGFTTEQFSFEVEMSLNQISKSLEYADSINAYFVKKNSVAKVSIENAIKFLHNVGLLKDYADIYILSAEMLKELKNFDTFLISKEIRTYRDLLIDEEVTPKVNDRKKELMQEINEKYFDMY